MKFTFYRRRDQCIEDYNARQSFAGLISRALLIVPITDAFDMPSTTLTRGKIQFSDRVSMPASLGLQLAQQQAEVPWHFQIQPLTAGEGHKVDVQCMCLMESVRVCSGNSDDILRSFLKDVYCAEVAFGDHLECAALQLTSAPQKMSSSRHSGCFVISDLLRLM